MRRRRPYEGSFMSGHLAGPARRPGAGRRRLREGGAAAGRRRGELQDWSAFERRIAVAVWRAVMPGRDEAESLILAQNERWRRA